MAGADLDPGTEALWLLAQLVPDRGVANVAVAIDMEQPVRWWPLRKAFDWLVRRHPALRTAFLVEAGRPVRREHPRRAVAEPDMVNCPSGDDLDGELRRYAARPFALDRPPLVRVGAFAAGADRHAICLATAHIVIDATSLYVLVGELNAAYRAFAAHGASPDLPPPQAEAPLPPSPSAEALSYWRARVAGYEASEMCLDGMRTAGGEPTFAGEQVNRTLGAEALRALATLRRASRGTDASVILACYHAALRRHGAGADQVVGVMVDGRGGTRAGVGYRMTTMPLRVTVDEDSAFVTHAGEVSRAVRAGMAHPDVPFELLARESRPGGDGPAWWRGRLVRHAFNFRPAAATVVPAGAAMREVCTGLSRFDTELTVDRAGGQVTLKLLYSSEGYDAAFAERFLARVERILCAAGADPTVPIGDIELQTEGDARAVARANDTAVRWAGPPSVLGMVDRAARDDPDAVAIVDDDTRSTYRQVLAAAAAVRDAVYGKGPLVALAGPRGASLAAAALGVWAAGAGYLPLDPEHPPRRLRQLLDDAGCEVVLGGEHLSAEARSGRLCLPLPAVAGEAAKLSTLDESGAAEDLAYLIFTSGSTGRPKGVRLSHGNLANVVRHFGRELSVGRATTAGWLTTFAFDISALELWLPLAHGGRVVVLPDEARAGGTRLLDVVHRHDVSIIQGTPTTWRTVVPLAAGRLRGGTVLCGGEPMTPALARDLCATGARVLNVYGPTETTIWSTVAEVAADGNPVPAGTPIANTRAYVLDQRGRPQPVGLSGELAIGGAGVALGYHERPELTAERFVTAGPLGRVYRTGDRARLRPDGALELLGRADRQVKLRAHRIELSEVEGVLEQHPLVRAAAVVLRGDPTADGFLAAFVVAKDGADIAGELWSHAAGELPGYSVPARITVLPELPHNASGKVDLTALEGWPLPDRAGAAGPAGTARYEERLVTLWREVLGRPHLGRDANFFLSGGHSLLALRLAEEATARCAVPVRLGMVFRAPTPAALARLIQAGP